MSSLPETQVQPVEHRVAALAVGVAEIVHLYHGVIVYVISVSH